MKNFQDADIDHIESTGLLKSSNEESLEQDFTPEGDELKILA